MSIASPSTTATAESLQGSTFDVAARRRVQDYAELCRPRIALMTMIAVAVGYTLASPIVFHPVTLFVALVGVVQLVAASSILNQCLERTTDARMNRTADRPIASGRIPVSEAVSVAVLLTATGFVLLWDLVNSLTAVATFSTLLVYVGGYTILKTRTSLCTTIGAIPGAMPPVLGWFAAGGAFSIEALSLFAVFFVWQFPHFLAIGWIHRNDYQAAGLRMLPSFSDQGLLTGLVAVVYAAVFVPVSMLPAYVSVAGQLYLVVATVASVAYLIYAVRFLFNRTEQSARSLLYNSLLCLPLLLVTLVIDFLRLTSPG